MTKPELLAPAGNLEKMKTAFAFGADAVYLGIPDFSLRVRINDFDLESIKIAVDYAHNLKKKVYVTINIFAHNKHIDKLPNYIKKLKEFNVDGVFVSDPGIFNIIKEIWPECHISLSTQANCTNWSSAKFWKDQGMNRVILGRETTLEEKKENLDMKIEVFVHGAMCMAYSGRCFLSKLLTGDRDANLGDCAQPCRWKYDIRPEGHDVDMELVEEKHGSYIMNSHDMCLLKRLPELIDLNLHAFKIEGRAKSVYYLANVVGAYRQAIDWIISGEKDLKNKLDYLYQELEQKLYHRGYTEGFMFNKGKLAQNLDNSHTNPDWEFCGQVINSKKGIIYVKVHNIIQLGDEIEIIKPHYDIINMKLNNIKDAETGEKINKAHGGGGGQVVILEIDEKIPIYSVLRRKIK